MPFRSVKQREYLKINHPEIYRKWKRKYGLKIVKSSSKKRYGRKNRNSRKKA